MPRQAILERAITISAKLRRLEVDPSMPVTVAVVLSFFPITVAPIAMVVSIVLSLISIILSLTIVWSLVGIVLSLIIILSLIRSAEQATDCTRSTTHAGTDRTANYAAHRPRSTTSLVRTLVGTALHTIEDALSMRLMRHDEQRQRCCSGCYWKYVF